MSVGVMKTSEHALTSKNGERQPPLVKRLAYYRQRSVELFLRASLSHLGQETCRQVLFLGAGIDLTLEKKYCQSTDECATRVYCVDFAEVLREREARYDYDDAQDTEVRASLVVADLQDSASLPTLLEAAGFDFTLPTVVVAEVVLAYMPNTAVESLLSMLSTLCHRHITLTYDPMLAPSSTSGGFGADMRRRFAARGAAVKFLCGSSTEYCAVLQRCGMDHVLGMDMLLFKNIFGQDETHPAFGEPFDEFHSLALTLRLYHQCLSCSHKTDLVAVWSVLRGAVNDDCGGSAVAADDFWARVQSKQEQVAQQAREGGHVAALEAVIVPAEPQDLSSLHALLQAAFDVVATKYKTVRKFIKTAKADMKKTVVSMQEGKWDPGNDRRSILLVAKKGARTVGCIGVSSRPSATGAPTWELQHMCVDETHRGCGLGRKLLHRALKEAGYGVSGCTVHLSVVRELEAARHLYSRTGFQDSETVSLGGGCVLHHMILEDGVAQST